MSVVFEWNGDQVGEGSGVGGMIDESPAGHDGDVIGTSAISDGPISSKRRQVVNASGASNKFEIPHSTDFDLGSNSLSFEMWVSRDSNYNTSNSQQLVRKLTTGPAGYLLRINATFQLVVSLYDGSTWMSFTTAANMILANETHYIGLTIDPSTQDVHIYRRGSEEPTTISGTTTSALGNTDVIHVFGAAAVHGWNGWLNAVRISTGILAAKHFYDAFNGSNIVEVN